MGALRTVLSCSSSLLPVDLVSALLCSVCFWRFFFTEVSTAFSLAFQLSPCAYVLEKNEWLDLMRGG